MDPVENSAQNKARRAPKRETQCNPEITKHLTNGCSSMLALYTVEKVYFTFQPKDSVGGVSGKQISLAQYADLEGWNRDLVTLIEKPPAELVLILEKAAETLGWPAQKTTLVGQNEIPMAAVMPLAMIYATYWSATHPGDTAVTLKQVTSFFDPETLKTFFVSQKGRLDAAAALDTMVKTFFSVTKEDARKTRDAEFLTMITNKILPQAQFDAMIEKEKRMDAVFKRVDDKIDTIETIEKDEGCSLLTIFEGTSRSVEFQTLYRYATKIKASELLKPEQAPEVIPSPTVQLPGTQAWAQMQLAKIVDCKPQVFPCVSRFLTTNEKDPRINPEIQDKVEMVTGQIFSEMAAYFETGKIPGYENIPSYTAMTCSLLGKVLKQTQHPVGMQGYVFVKSSGQVSEVGLKESRDFISDVANIQMMSEFPGVTIYFMALRRPRHVKKLVQDVKKWLDDAEAFPDHSHSQIAIAVIFFLMLNANHHATKPSVTSISTLSGIETFYSFIDESFANSMIQLAPTLPTQTIVKQEGVKKPVVDSGVVVLLDSDDDEAPAVDPVVPAVAQVAAPAVAQAADVGEKRKPEPLEKESIDRKKGKTGASNFKKAPLSVANRALFTAMMLAGVEKHRLDEHNEKNRAAEEVVNVQKSVSEIIGGKASTLKKIAQMPSLIDSPEEALSFTDYEPSEASVVEQLALLEGKLPHARLRMVAFSIEVLQEAFRRNDLAAPAWCSPNAFEGKVQAEFKAMEFRGCGGGS